MDEDQIIASYLRRLRNQTSTPPGMNRRLIDRIEAEGLAVFKEWPCGHWQITEAGSEFYREHIGTF